MKKVRIEAVSGTGTVALFESFDAACAWVDEAPDPYDPRALDASMAIDIFTFSGDDFAEAEWVGYEFDHNGVSSTRYDMVRFAVVKYVNSGLSGRMLTSHCGWCLPGAVLFTDTSEKNLKFTRIEAGEVDMETLFDDNGSVKEDE